MELPSAQNRGNLLVNADFQGGSYSGWTLDPALERAGSISVEGGGRVRLTPNTNNSNKDKPFGLGQFLSVSGVAGQTLTVQASIKSDGAFGVVLAFAVDSRGKPVANAIMQQLDVTADFRLQRKTLTLPKNAANIIFGIVTPSTSGSVTFGDVYIGPGEPPATAPSAVPPPRRGNPERRTGDEQRPNAAAASITIDAARVLRQIPKEMFGTNVEWVRNANTIWDSRRQAARPEIVQRARELGVTLVRYPGGGFADYYNWRDGVGPRGARPVRTHGLDAGKSAVLFGTHELVEFCRGIGAEPMIQANVVTGTAKEAGDWVAYCNRPGHPDRAANGSPEPFRIRFWEIGNEQYIKPDGSLPLPAESYMTPARYAGKFKEYAAAMRAADPSIKLGIIGGRNFGFYRMLHDENWNEIVLKETAGQADFVSIHNAYGPLTVGDAEKGSFEDVYRAMFAFPKQVEQNLKDVNRDIARFAGPNASRMKIAVTEWGPLFAFDLSNRYIDHVRTLGSGLFVASLFQTFLRAERVDITTFFKLTEEGFMGWVNGANGEPKPVYYALQMYTRHFGTRLVDAQVSSPSFNAAASGSCRGDPQCPVPRRRGVAQRRLGQVVRRRGQQALRGTHSVGSSRKRVSTGSRCEDLGADRAKPRCEQWRRHARTGPPGSGAARFHVQLRPAGNGKAGRKRVYERQPELHFRVCAPLRNRD